MLCVIVPSPENEVHRFFVFEAHQHGVKFVDDLLHQGLHFLLANAGYFIPRNRSLRGNHFDVRKVARLGYDGFTGMQVLKERVSHAEDGQCLGKPGGVLLLWFVAHATWVPRSHSHHNAKRTDAGPRRLVRTGPILRAPQTGFGFRGKGLSGRLAALNGLSLPALSLRRPLPLAGSGIARR
jgi:hypothetical protein